MSDVGAFGGPTMGRTPAPFLGKGDTGLRQDQLGVGGGEVLCPQVVLVDVADPVTGEGLSAARSGKREYEVSEAMAPSTRLRSGAATAAAATAKPSQARETHGR
jgi:hypothetical protein